MKNKRRKRISRRAKRGVHCSHKCPNPFVYRSGWELKYALYLDESADVVSYLYEPYPVEYVSNLKTGKRRKYWPDFEVTMRDGTVVLVEIKPKKKLTLLMNIKKFAAASAMCASRGINFCIVTEVNLKELGLL
jgi:hypothetical protein